LQEKLMQKAGVDRLHALYLAIDLVRRGGTISILGVYGGMADPLPMLTLFDKQIQLRTQELARALDARPVAIPAGVRACRAERELATASPADPAGLARHGPCSPDHGHPPRPGGAGLAAAPQLDRCDPRGARGAAGRGRGADAAAPARKSRALRAGAGG
jgi:hypothetical protein